MRTGIQQGLPGPVLLGLILDEVDPGSPQSRDQGLAQAAPVLAGIAAGATREELTRRVAERLGIEPTVVVARLSQAPVPEPEPLRNVASANGSDPGSSTPAGWPTSC